MSFEWNLLQNFLAHSAEIISVKCRRLLHNKSGLKFLFVSNLKWKNKQRLRIVENNST